MGNDREKQKMLRKRSRKQQFLVNDSLDHLRLGFGHTEKNIRKQVV